MQCTKEKEKGRGSCHFLENIEAPPKIQMRGVTFHWRPKARQCSIMQHFCYSKKHTSKFARLSSIWSPNWLFDFYCYLSLDPVKDFPGYNHEGGFGHYIELNVTAELAFCTLILGRYSSLNCK